MRLPVFARFFEMDQQRYDMIAVVAMILAIAGLLLLFLRARRRRKANRAIRYVHELAEQTDLFVLAQIPRFQTEVPWSAGLPAELEQQLGHPLELLTRHIYWALYPSTKLRIMVTSPGPGEGKSFVAANLATALANKGNRTLIVDATRSRRVLHKWFHLDDGVGLAELALALQEAKERAPQEIEQLTMKFCQPTRVENLFLLTRGFGSDGSSSRAAFDVWTQVAEQFDAIVLDAPSLAEINDFWKLPFWQDLLLVTKIDQTRVHALQNSMRQLQRAQIRVIGTVATCVPDGQLTDDDIRADESEGAEKLIEFSAPLPAEAVEDMVDTHILVEAQTPVEAQSPIETQVSQAFVLKQLAEIEHLTKRLAELEKQSHLWEQRTRELEEQVQIEKTAQASEHNIDDLQLQLSRQQAEIIRLKDVAAEYRRVLARQERDLEESKAKFANAEKMIRIQTEQIVYLKTKAYTGETIAENTRLGGHQAGDVSGD